VGATLVGFGAGRLFVALDLVALIRSQAAAISVASVGEAAVVILLGIFVAAAAPSLVAGFSNARLTGSIRRWGMLLFEGVRAPVSVAPVPGARGATGRPTAKTQDHRVRVSRDWLLWTLLVLVAAVGAVAGLSAGRRALIVLGMVLLIGFVVLLLRRPEVVLLVMAAFPWVDWAARRAAPGYGGGWDDPFLIFSVLLFFWGLVFLRRVRLRTVPILVPALLCAVLAVSSVLINSVQTYVAIVGGRLLLEPVIYYFVGFLFPKNRRWVQWTIGIFLLSGVLLALHGLYQYVTHAPMPYSWVASNEQGIITTRAYSIIGNPNGLGALLLMGTLISLSFALKSGLRASQRWGMAAVCLIHTAGIAVTFSRGAWLALGVGVVALLLTEYRRYLVPLLGVGVMAWFVAPSAFTNRLRFAFSSSYLEQSQSFGRLRIWSLALTKAMEHPFSGVGLGTFAGVRASIYGTGKLWVDNVYLQFAAEGGLILLAAYLWLLLRTGKGLIKAFLAARDPYMRALVAGTFSGCVAICVVNVTAGVWQTIIGTGPGWTLSVGVTFWLLAGLATSAASPGLRASAEESAKQIED
jgi:O-antigen ligase